MIPESISSGILSPNSIIEIEITDKQIIGVLPNKTIIRDLSEFTNYMIVKDGIFLMMNNKKEKKYILDNVKIKFTKMDRLIFTNLDRII